MKKPILSNYSYTPNYTSISTCYDYEKYSPKWLLEKINDSKTDGHKLMHIIEYRKELIESYKKQLTLTGVSTSTDIEVGSIVKYLPKDPSSWIGVVTEIKNDEETKRHGHSGDVYIVQDPFSTVSIATIKENLLKGEFV